MHPYKFIQTKMYNVFFIYIRKLKRISKLFLSFVLILQLKTQESRLNYFNIHLHSLQCIDFSFKRNISFY